MVLAENNSQHHSENQRIYDDLKHVDFNFIDYDGLLIEQDKKLGKGGLCWDAAFVLAEYLSSESLMWKDKTRQLEGTTQIIELGAGTGICGLLIAKNVDDVAVSLTDLPELQPLLSRNAKRFLDNGNDDHSFKARSAVAVFELDWADDSGWCGKFDIVLGSDVVATLYDPVALAHTIHRLCHDGTVVYVSFKERLASIHRSFEEEMKHLFSEVSVIHNGKSKMLSRNHNPDVHILIANGKISAMSAPRLDSEELPSAPQSRTPAASHLREAKKRDTRHVEESADRGRNSKVDLQHPNDPPNSSFLSPTMPYQS